MLRAIESRGLDGLLDELTPELEAVDPSDFERQLENLLGRCRDRYAKVKIHCKAVEVYSAVKPLWRATKLPYHAAEGLKYQRHPVERSKLYVALGKFAEIHDNDAESFLKSRDAASHWYLKGYTELLPFRLPDTPPDLPKVEEKTCVTCHTPSNSPSFVFKSFWKKIKH